MAGSEIVCALPGCGSDTRNRTIKNGPRLSIESADRRKGAVSRPARPPAIRLQLADGRKARTPPKTDSAAAVFLVRTRRNSAQGLYEPQNPRSGPLNHC